LGGHDIGLRERRAKPRRRVPGPPQRRRRQHQPTRPRLTRIHGPTAYDRRVPPSILTAPRDAPERTRTPRPQHRAFGKVPGNDAGGETDSETDGVDAGRPPARAPRVGPPRVDASPEPPDDRVRGWIVTLVITAIASVTRFVMLGSPTDAGTPIFDEKHYAPQAWQ